MKYLICMQTILILMILSCDLLPLEKVEFYIKWKDAKEILVNESAIVDYIEYDYGDENSKEKWFYFNTKQNDKYKVIYDEIAPSYSYKGSNIYVYDNDIEEIKKLKMQTEDATFDINVSKNTTNFIKIELIDDYDDLKYSFRIIDG
ncbi:MAG: hypothetical protein KAT05_02325 [Spirochaetes bacterium]|nr:hypothetical protein [Spirochaetota bacterium]